MRFLGPLGVGIGDGAPSLATYKGGGFGVGPFAAFFNTTGDMGGGLGVRVREGVESGASFAVGGGQGGGRGRGGGALLDRLALDGEAPLPSNVWSNRRAKFSPSCFPGPGGGGICMRGCNCVGPLGGGASKDFWTFPTDGKMSLCRTLSIGAPTGGGGPSLAFSGARLWPERICCFCLRRSSSSRRFLTVSTDPTSSDPALTFFAGGATGCIGDDKELMRQTQKSEW